MGLKMFNCKNVVKRSGKELVSFRYLQVSDA
jgi:hypothetical protein